jgi:hypothetical protein
MRLIRLLPAALTVLPIALLWPTLEGVLASVAWIALIAVSRLPRHRLRSERLSLDRLIVVICSVGFFLGGLYWLPAAGTFWLVDRFDTNSNLRNRDRPIPLDTPRLEMSLGILAGVAGLTGIAAFLFLPIYTVARSNAVPIGGASTSTVQGATGLEVGLAPGGAGTIVVTALLFIFVGLGAIISRRRHVAGRAIVGVAGFGVVLISAIGALTIGTFLLPGVVLTLLTVGTVFRSRPKAQGTPS